MTARHHPANAVQPRRPLLRKTAWQILSGDVVEEGGRYRGIVHAIHHHGMCVTVELADGARIDMGPGDVISIRA